eukprot:m.410409 g.410409  ORF g.410409 m.410409 type:complete len:61 (+) comp56538_c0_seq3:1-183(+)
MRKQRDDLLQNVLDVQARIQLLKEKAWRAFSRALLAALLSQHFFAILSTQHFHAGLRGVE